MHYSSLMVFENILKSTITDIPNVIKFFGDIGKALKLSSVSQILFLLSILHWSRNTPNENDALKAFKKKLGDFYLNEKPTIFPSYAIYAIVSILYEESDTKKATEDPYSPQDIFRFIGGQESMDKSFLALTGSGLLAGNSDIINSDESKDYMSYLEHTDKMLEPW